MKNEMLQAKLYDFKAIDIEKESEDKYKDNNIFTIQLYLIDSDKSYSLIINNFHPFFYIKCPSGWDQGKKHYLIEIIKNYIGKYYENSIIVNECKFEKKKTLYGFDAGKVYNFFKIVFKSQRALNKAKSIFWKKQCDDSSCKKWQSCNHTQCYSCNKEWKDSYNLKRELSTTGIYYEKEKKEINIQSYEANIPTLLRFLHTNKLNPSGWIQVSKKNLLKNEEKISHCTEEYNCSYKAIKPLNIEDPVPYKIMSFDIEADSQDGDFPLAIKSYKKLATQIVDLTHKNEEITKENIKIKLRNWVKAAFGFRQIDEIDIVYPIKEITNEIDLDDTIDKWLNDTIKKGKALKEIKKEEEEEDLEEEKSNTQTFCRPNCTVIDLLLNNRIHRTTKILGIENSFWMENKHKLFPQLKGDYITFIGSTFLKYGDEKPYLNNCLALGECDMVNGAEIVSCETEELLLLEWTKLVQRENPDIIIGYNQFGFDCSYLFKRAKQYGKKTLTEFIKLSKNIDEECVRKDWKDRTDIKHWKIEEKISTLASGDHELNYFNMSGRIQIDLLNLFRREHNLSSYKLDFVSGHFIGDSVKSIENNKIYSNNLNGLEKECFIHFEEIGYTSEYYNNGEKFKVIDIDKGWFSIDKIVNPDFEKKIRWCLAKDDVTPQDIFRLGRGTPKEKALVAKYCIQDCNLVHQLLRKLDIITGFVEMSKICYVPMNFLVLRGQGIKLTSFIAQKCSEKNTLMPDIQKDDSQDGYEGAIVLDPKTGYYQDDPVACVDYSSLYPSSMISENICHSSLVWTKEYNLEGILVEETGIKNDENEYEFDNLENYEYVDIKYDTYTYVRKTPKSAAQKVKVGYKICRFAQYPNDDKAIMPSVLQELLNQRNATKKLMKKEKDPFMKNVYDKRQLSIKLTANSLYGQCGAKTSSFYQKDIAASTTATGRKLLTYAKRIIEEVYSDKICDTKEDGQVRTRAEYVYGDTDSVFFTLHLEELNGEKIKGEKSLKLTIELAQEVGKLATKFLKHPHDLEYEKTFRPFALLSKKRYVGMLYEFDINKKKRKEMGIVLKRRDNAGIVKVAYGGVIDLMMKGEPIDNAIKYIQDLLEKLIKGEITIDKLIITKSLRSHYKNPQQIAHKVLADRIGRRDPGNKPRSGDRIAYIYIKNSDKKALQGDRIETPEYIIKHNLEIDYNHYITNQIMKPLLQLFALVLYDIPKFKKSVLKRRELEKQLLEYKEILDNDKYLKKKEQLEHKIIKNLIFDKYILK